MATINGHEIDEHIVDKFLDGETGEPISDEAWDESKLRELETDPDEINWEPLS